MDSIKQSSLRVCMYERVRNVTNYLQLACEWPGGKEQILSCEVQAVDGSVLSEEVAQ